MSYIIYWLNYKGLNPLLSKLLTHKNEPGSIPRINFKGFGKKCHFCTELILVCYYQKKLNLLIDNFIFFNNIFFMKSSLFLFAYSDPLFHSSIINI